MFGFGILSGLTFLPLVGAAFILTQRGDSESSLRNVRWAALLTTIAPLPIDTELTLEVTPPGAAAPIAIAGRVSYHVPSGGSGLRFVSRDGDGDRRLRELIRRLRAS